MYEASSTRLYSACLSPALDNYSEEEYESFSSEQEASDDAVQGQVSPPKGHEAKHFVSSWWVG